MNKPIIMGRKTHESVGRPLPGRRNIVITRNEAFDAPGCETCDSIESAIKITGDVAEAVVIGGMGIYQQVMPVVQRMYVTEIDAVFEGDAWFPEINQQQWCCTEREEHVHRDDSGGFTYRFLVYERAD